MPNDWWFPTAFASWKPGDGSEEDQALHRVLRSGQLTMGLEVAAFEAEFAAFHGRKHAVMTNSGSSANLLAVACLFHKRRDPLRRDDDNWRGRHALVPALAWSTTFAPVVQHGLKLILADCDATWNAPADNPDWGDAKPGPRLVVMCSILGNPGYGAEWAKVAEESHAYLLHDNCESFGAVDERGVLASNYGLLSTHSLFYSHQISAIEGGVILTDDEELANICRILRAHGWTRDVWRDPLGNPSRPPRFEQEYDFTLMGYQVRPVEIHAAVAREQLKKTRQFRNARIHNFYQFRRLTENLPIVHPTMRGEHNPFGLHFLCEREADRADLVAALRANGIDARLPTGGSLRLHAYGKPYENQATPTADLIHRRGLFLGNAPYPIPDRVEKAAKVMRAVFDAKARAA
jgi:CDP-6-deoxy-D-xylo-4-hexulose-3-dehydrase